MFIKSLTIENFKSFKNVTIHFNNDLNILTGTNNSGKTTVLEALSLWNECFSKLINKAGRAVGSEYKKDDYILGPSGNKYFNFDDINSVRSPNSEDIFHLRFKRNKIKLTAVLENKDKEEITIPFKVSDSGGNYVIEFLKIAYTGFSNFNSFFQHLPDAINVYYASPVSFINQREDFATEPQIKDSINKRLSSQVIRNRIYKLYQSPRFQEFQRDLSYILYSQINAKLIITNKSDIQKDSRVLINAGFIKNDVEKDIALFGSGTLQIIEILLNLYQQSDVEKDLSVVLLDEPDSHIHRDIQNRLIEILTRFSSNNQIFVTTHNESLIRSTPLSKLFHLDGNAESEIKNMYFANLESINTPHFKGIYPSSLNPIIRNIGSGNGLDFINAIEADKIIFVEGQDDARVIYRLLQEYPQNYNRKFMFWVLGSVSKIFKDITSYKTVFSDIKNEKTLWEKSYLIYDKDALIDGHSIVISQTIQSKLLLANNCGSAYTQEAVLFTEFDKLTLLINEWLSNKEVQNIETKELQQNLLSAYEIIKEKLQERYSMSHIESSLHQSYLGQYSNQTLKMFSLRSTLIESNPVKLVSALNSYYSTIINNGQYYKLMTKQDVEFVLNEALKKYSEEINIETQFYELIQLVSKSTWFQEWDYLKNI